MASKFHKTMSGIKNVLSGKTMLDKSKLLGQNLENKCAIQLANVQTKQEIHLSSKQDYPQAKPLPLPINIDPTESTRFSPQRARDITSTAIATNIWNRIDITIDSSIAPSSAMVSMAVSSMSDPHVSSYDCTGAVSLSSSMQSNVPNPFNATNSFSHLSMPGGQWEQGSKWMSHDLQTSHYTNLRRETRKNWSKSGGSVNNKSDRPNDKGSIVALLQNRLHGQMLIPSNARFFSTITTTTAIATDHLNMINNISKYNAIHSSVLFINTNQLLLLPSCKYSTNKSIIDQKAEKKSAANNSIDQENSDNSRGVNSSTQSNDTAKPISRTELLKKTVKDYGATVIVFHVSLSLMSLGLFYQLVASGLDVVALLEYIGLANSTVTTNIATGASTFVIAYAVHKIFAPIRISITLFSTPLIVRYLRKKGILKEPKK